MSVQTDLEARTAQLTAILEDSNAAVTAKGGTTTAANLAGIPEAILSIPKSSGGGSSGGDDSGDDTGDTTQDAYPAMEIPAEYQSYVDYAVENLYSGDYAELMILDYGDWLCVCFLMDDFEIIEYNESTSEFTASGWVSCAYVRSTGEWTMNDMRESDNGGGSYIAHVTYASCYLSYGNQTLFPLPVNTEVDITAVNFDNFDNGTFTVTYATGNSEVITMLTDDSGAYIGVQDAYGNTVTLTGV